MLIRNQHSNRSIVLRAGSLELFSRKDQAGRWDELPTTKIRHGPARWVRREPSAHGGVARYWCLNAAPGDGVEQRINSACRQSDNHDPIRGVALARYRSELHWPSCTSTGKPARGCRWCAAVNGGARPAFRRASWEDEVELPVNADCGRVNGPRHSCERHPTARPGRSKQARAVRSGPMHLGDRSGSDAGFLPPTCAALSGERTTVPPGRPSTLRQRSCSPAIGRRHNTRLRRAG